MFHLRRRALAGYVLVTAAAILGAAQARPAPATGAVSGVVIEAGSGASVAGAVVSIRRVGVTASIRQQITDSRGRFVFDELEPSTQYAIHASKPGYASAEYPRLPGQPPGTVFSLADGQWLSTASLEMSRLGAIGGFVTDESGEPVVGAFVRAIAEISVGGRRVLAAGPIAKTDDRGEYRLAGLQAGPYFVMLPSVQHSVPATTPPAQVEGLREDIYQRLESAVARNAATPRLNNGTLGDFDTRRIIGNFVTPPPSVEGRDRAYPLTFFPGARSIESAMAIEIAGGEDRSGVDTRIQPVAAVRVSGRLAGLAAPAKLTLRLIPAGLEQLSTGSEAATTVVDADGTFAFLGVPEGQYILDARQSQFEFTLQPVYVPNAPSLPPTPGRELLGAQMVGWLAAGPRGSGYSARLSPPGAGYFGRLTVNVGATDISDLLVSVNRTLSVRGRFVYEDVPTPPARALPVIAEPADRHFDLGFASSRAEDPGADVATFTITHVLPGSYNLRVTPGPSARFVVKSIAVDGQDHLTKPIEIRDDVSDVVITLTGRPAVLTGVVRTAQGQPADHAAVIVFPTDRTMWAALGLMPVSAKQAPTSPDGTFTLSTLPAGEYDVVALDRARQDWCDPAFFERAAAVATRVSTEWGRSRSVTLGLVAVK